MDDGACSKDVRFDLVTCLTTRNPWMGGVSPIDTCKQSWTL